MSRHHPSAHVGTSGYQYDHWRGVFYPRDLPREKWFTYYARHFGTVEINNTFYNLPASEVFEQWYDQASDTFLYTLKFSRYGTHMKKLKNGREVLDTFMARAAHLKQKLGPILVQLPPNWNVNEKRLDSFLAAVPDNQRVAVEFRDPSWLCEAVFAVLRTHGSALCVHDKIEDHPDEATAGWVYYRFHGEDYGGTYSHQKLSAVADKLAGHLAENRDVFVYFNNDRDGHAVSNARDLRRYVEKRRS